MYPADLPAEWRGKAAELSQMGASDQATLLLWAADDLEETWRFWATEPLTLEEASGESGYSYSSLQQQVACGEIPNVGETGRPRIRRKDLPSKAPTRSHEEEGEPDIAAEILAEKL